MLFIKKKTLRNIFKNTGKMHRHHAESCFRCCRKVIDINRHWAVYHVWLFTYRRLRMTRTTDSVTMTTAPTTTPTAITASHNTHTYKHLWYDIVVVVVVRAFYAVHGGCKLHPNQARGNPGEGGILADNYGTLHHTIWLPAHDRRHLGGGQ